MEMTRRLVTFPVPTIAAIRGAALAGGLEIAMCCDFLVATDDAKIGDQHINHGLIPGGGATETIVNRIGSQRAKDLILTGRRISGTEAARIGLALWSVPDESFDEALNTFAVQLSDKRREASRLVKMLIGPEHDFDGIAQEQDVAAYDMSGDEILTILRGFGSD
jgi:enoyl-CoA hydratase/carnithine racemase